MKERDKMETELKKEGSSPIGQVSSASLLPSSPVVQSNSSSRVLSFAKSNPIHRPPLLKLPFRIECEMTLKKNSRLSKRIMLCC